ncbi:MAG: hypothetical protein ACLQCU_12665 [Acidimicrobiales bacterium]
MSNQADPRGLLQRCSGNPILGPYDFPKMVNAVFDPVRGLQPQPDRFEEHWGIEDPRITRVGDEYFVDYVGYSTAGPLVCLARARDFVQWERSGVLQPLEDRDAALLPKTLMGGGP